MAKPAKDYTPNSSLSPSRDGRDSALGRALQQIERQFGKGSVMKFGETPPKIDGTPTGSLSLDIALGGSGIPNGSIVTSPDFAAALRDG